MTATVRAALLADLGAIEGVQEAAARAADLDGVRDAVADPHRVVVVAEVGGDVVGWAKTHRYDRPDGGAPAGHYLGGVTVRPEVRRRGVATALTEARMAWVARRADRAYYLVNAGNRASIALHERWGFREIARGEAFHRVRFAGGLGLVLGADVGPAAPPLSAAGAR